MDVKASNAYIPAAIPDVRLRPAPLLQRTSHPSSTMFPDDIIDCVEITMASPPINSDKIGYGPSDKPRMAKGKLIDIWI